MKTGVSLYLGSGDLTNSCVISRAWKAGAELAFTSLHIPEEEGVDYAQSVRSLLEQLREYNMGLIADIGPRTFEKLGCSSIEELADLGITHVRLDYGFDAQATADLSKTFHIVCNASTVDADDVRAWRKAGADLTRFAACHNFYPKPWTGLSAEDVARRNAQLHAWGFETIGFVPGDGEKRGPLQEGLPTLEEQRNRAGEVARNMLELAFVCGCDTVLVGDVSLSEAGWAQFEGVNRGVVDIHCELCDRSAWLLGSTHHDRPDSSPWVFRSRESRDEEVGPAPDEGVAGHERRAGSIAISNEKYGRYEGELEIARVDLPGDPRMNVVGRVADEDLELVKLIRNGFGLRFV